METIRRDRVNGRWAGGRPMPRLRGSRRPVVALASKGKSPTTNAMESTVVGLPTRAWRKAVRLWDGRVTRPRAA